MADGRTPFALALMGGLRRANRVVAMLIGVVLLACTVFVLADIVLRQIGSSLGGTDEISGYVMAIVTSWGMGYALLELSHVRIDMLRARAGARGRAVFDLFAMTVLSVTITVIAWQCWPVLARSLANTSKANTPLETPLWIVQLPWFAGWVWFAAVAWLTLVAALLLIAQGRFEDSEAIVGVFAEQDAAP